MIVMINNNDIPFTSIVVLNYNSKKHLDDCFNSLALINYPKDKYEVLLIDNDSSDDSVEYTNKKYPWIQTIKLNENYGYAEGNNRGVRYTQGKYVLFLNPDTKVHENWLMELVKCLEYDEDTIIAGCKVLFFDRPNIIQSAGQMITPIGSGYGIGFDELDEGQFDEKMCVPSVSGCSMIVKKDMFLQLGGFDKDYFAYVEEVDLSLRAWLMGFKTQYVPTSIVYHKFGGDFGSSESPARIFYSQKNRLATIVKNFELDGVLKGLAISLLFDVVRAITFISKGNSKSAFAILKGIYYFIKELPKTIEKRNQIQATRILSDNELYRKELVVSLMGCIQEYVKVETN